MDTTAVEINPGVVAACRAFFRLPADGPRLQVLIGDAAAWLRREDVPSTVRLLHVDLYDHEAAAPVLDDVAFYAACRDMLEPGGVMAVNLFGRHASFERSATRIAQAFGADQVWRLRATREGNTVVVAGRGVAWPDRPTLAARADAIEARFAKLGLPARKWLRMVTRWPGTASPEVAG
jgi:spermidine synthase